MVPEWRRTCTLFLVSHNVKAAQKLSKGIFVTGRALAHCLLLLRDDRITSKATIMRGLLTKVTFVNDHPQKVQIKKSVTC